MAKKKVNEPEVKSVPAKRVAAEGIPVITREQLEELIQENAGKFPPLTGF